MFEACILLIAIYSVDNSWPWGLSVGIRANRHICLEGNWIYIIQIQIYNTDPLLLNANPFQFCVPILVLSTLSNCH